MVHAMKGGGFRPRKVIFFLSKELHENYCQLRGASTLFTRIPCSLPSHFEEILDSKEFQRGVLPLTTSLFHVLVAFSVC